MSKIVATPYITIENYFIIQEFPLGIKAKKQKKRMTQGVRISPSNSDRERHLWS